MNSDSNHPVVAVIQARHSSRRLPGKVLRPLAGKPMLEWVVRRAALAKTVDKVVVATSFDRSDDPVAEWCRDNRVGCFRGSLEDVLQRFTDAALSQGAAHVVRITADCPLIDPRVIDQFVTEHLKTGVEFTTCHIPRGIPDGLDVEVFKIEALVRAAAECGDLWDREHPDEHLLKNPKSFPQKNLCPDASLAEHRWTVDTAEDMTWADQVLSALGKLDFTQADVLKITQEKKLERFQSHQPEEPAKPRTEGKGQDLYAYARKNRIPGGTQLLSKRPEMYLPGRWPSYYAAARGAWVKDLDGRSYIDMASNGLGSLILGAADPVVNAAAHDAVSRSPMSTLNAPEEVELADVLCEMHPWAERARFARSGGEAMAIAVRIARAASGKDVVLFSGYHGWSDWYLATNLKRSDGLDQLLLPGLSTSGVPRGLTGTSVPFHFNSREEFDGLIAQHGENLGVIVMEVQRGSPPDKVFLQHIRDTCTRLGAVLVFDEITSGFRLIAGGVHLLYGVMPDIAVFGKAIANGFAMSAVIGRASAMEAAQGTFISSTFWTERIGPSAALATIKRYNELDGATHLSKMGGEAQRIWRETSAAAGIKVTAGPDHMKPLSSFALHLDDKSLVMPARTLWCKLMLERGMLCNAAFFPTCAHGQRELDLYEEACASAFKELASALDAGTVREQAGEVAHSGFQRLIS
ncbi:MAG: aminotransferase class III-fold pyridoxal phosphate-dependent enzyme [Verrucomicrobiaceae bacterium]|nr:aminotransferase class III-fold pyridoxal phosphate-dependent enzyme [Verrucomicrobiaceae bacterium]